MIGKLILDIERVIPPDWAILIVRNSEGDGIKYSLNQRWLGNITNHDGSEAYKVRAGTPFDALSGAFEAYKKAKGH